jgi:hypothetical protein
MFVKRVLSPLILRVTNIYILEMNFNAVPCLFSFFAHKRMKFEITTSTILKTGILQFRQA